MLLADEPNGTTTLYTFGNGLLGEETAIKGKSKKEETIYRIFHYDHLGSTTTVTDEKDSYIMANMEL